MKIGRVGTIAAALFAAQAAFAQQRPTTPPPVIPNPSSGSNLLAFFSARTPYEFWLTCVIGAIGLIILAAMIIAVGRTQKPRPEDITRPLIVIAVIISTLILVTAGYSNEQIAPAFGLFGTIIGYLLGRSGSPNNVPGPQPADASGGPIAEKPKASDTTQQPEEAQQPSAGSSSKEFPR